MEDEEKMEDDVVRLYSADGEIIFEVFFEEEDGVNTVEKYMQTWDDPEDRLPVEEKINEICWKVIYNENPCYLWVNEPAGVRFDSAGEDCAAKYEG